MQCADEYTVRLAQHVRASFAANFAQLAGMAEGALAEIDGLAAACREAAEDAVRRLEAENSACVHGHQHSPPL